MYFIDHKRPIKAIEPFALSFFSFSGSSRDLFYAVFLASYLKAQRAYLSTNSITSGDSKEKGIISNE